jgi:hypothetical protein
VTAGKVALREGSAVQVLGQQDTKDKKQTASAAKPADRKR